MVHEYTRDRLEAWVADFCETDGLRGVPGALAEHAPGLLVSWLEDACDRADVEPEELTAEALREALLRTIARAALPDEAHAAVPGLCRDLLARLEEDGRLGDGRVLGLTLHAQREAYERAVTGKVETLRRPGAKLGRNDPCPCGSGRKYKKCCMRG